MNHIKSAHNDTESYCGENLGNDFHFKTVDAAVLNGLHNNQSSTKTCIKCTQIIIGYLTQGSM